MKGRPPAGGGVRTGLGSPCPCHTGPRPIVIAGGFRRHHPLALNLGRMESLGVLGLGPWGDPHDCVSAAILSTWKGGTRDAYASHLRHLAQIGGRTAWSDAQRVVELALFQMFKMGFRKATLRGCVSAVKACVVLGWLPELNWTRLWRITKAPVDSEVHRPYGGPDVLQIIAEACASVEDWITYAGCVLSFSSLSRVGEVSSARRNGVGKSHFSFWGLKRG